MNNLRIFISIVFLGFGLTIIPNAQENRTPEKHYRIQVGVEEVRLDAVVVDNKGRQITDLTADDFEIYQDDQPQRIFSSTYISENQAPPGEKTIYSRDAKKTPLIPSPALTKDDVRRTIVFLVDDISMNFQDLSNAHMALQKFVETQMQPGDLVAIMQTKGWTAGLQTFSSDKRQLLARIGNVRWSTLRRPDGYPIGIPQILAIDYSIRALRDMPGRKFLLLLSTQIMLPASVSDDAAFNGLADAALRAGVVIHTLDILGLVNNSIVQQITQDPITGEIITEVDLLDAETRSFTDKTGREFDYIFNNNGPTPGMIRLSQVNERKRNKPFPLSKKTGGLFLSANNFFVNGIGAVEEEMKGFYLLSYVPPANTFKPDKPIAYHKLKIKVKRPGTEIRTRDGFYGAPDTLREPAKDKNPFNEAVFSPFRYNDLNLKLAAGYIDDPPKGHLLRAWLHLDGRLVGFINEKDGSHSISLEAVAITSDINSLIQDSGNVRIGFHVNDKDIQWIHENGIKFSLSLPGKKPGAYFVRAAVKDQASGAIGSAYQFVEIPDIAKNGLSLSSIFIINRDEDMSWIQSGEVEESQGQPGISKQVARRSQAFRSFLPGESLDYMAVIYNANNKEGLRPDLESQFVLFQNGNEIFRSKPEAVSLDGVKDFKRIMVKKRLKLEKTMQPGDYVLQLQARDKRTKEKQSLAAQTLDFEIAAKSSDAAFSQNPSQQEAPANAKSKTVVDMTAEELNRFYHDDLSHVEFDLSQDQLDYLLKQAGDRVVAFFRDLSNTASKERVRMQRSSNRIQTTPTVDAARGDTTTDTITGIGRNPRGASFRWVDLMNAEYDYLILPGSGNAGTTWVEDRVNPKNGSIINPKTTQGFILSSGHAGKCLYLHPGHQANSYFRYLGREKTKPRAHVIAFAQKPEAGDYLAQFFDADSSTSIRYLIQGFVWLDPDSYQIRRMRTYMLSPERRTMLKETITDIDYGKVQFDNPRRELWLPREIYIWWKFPNWTYCNQHTYSNYHLFTVDADYKIKLPEVSK
jgi:VWFA-related protein